MKYKIIITFCLFLIFYQCQNKSGIDSHNFKRLDKNIELTKWEIYKSNLNVYLKIDSVLDSISFIECDLERFIDPLDTAMLGYLRHDTVQKICFFPIYKGKPIDIPSNTIYGVAFKNDIIKYIIHSEDTYVKFDSNDSRIQEKYLIDMIKNKNTKVNLWLNNYIEQNFK